MAHNKEAKISWNKDVKYASKQQFIDLHKDAYPNVDLGAEFDRAFGKAPKEVAPEK